MAAGRSAAMKLDWTRLPSQLGLKGNTLASLNAFKKRHDDARRRVTALSNMPETVDFQHYRSVLKNSQIVDEVERQFKAAEIKKIEVSKQLKAIEAYEAQAMKSAEETKSIVDNEVRALEKTLSNIETARPFDQLTVDDVAAARPDVDEKTTQLVAKGRWMIPGYKEKFGDLSLV